MKVKFKEKTYEKYVSAELTRLTNQFFSPDACDENFLGFDDAFVLPWSLVASLAPFVRRSRHRHLMGLRLAELEFLIDELSEHLPPFKFNLFLQYKRPEYMKRSDAAEWHFWSKRYYRYTTTPHQQALLEKIEVQAAGRAATLYAGAAFWNSTDLFAHAQAGEVLKNSNLANVAKLQGHERFTYTQPGTKGIACSEPTPIESDPLQDIISRTQDLEPLPFDRHIQQAAKVIDQVVGEGDRYIRDLYAQARRALNIETPRSNPTIAAMKSIIAFSDAFDVSYYALGEATKTG